MPTSITRAKYNSPIQGKLNPKTKKLERTKPDGSALSSSVTFENPAPATAAGLPLDKKDTFSLASGWESGIYGRSIRKNLPVRRTDISRVRHLILLRELKSYWIMLP